MLNIGIVGSRTYPDLDFVQIVTRVLWWAEPYKLISGGATGPDTASEKALKSFLNEKEIEEHIQIFYPNWKMYGKIAGLHRNGHIASNSKLIICFYNSQSKTHGCLDTLKRSIKLQRPTICLDENKEVAHWFLDKLNDENILNKDNILKIIDEIILSTSC